MRSVRKRRVIYPFSPYWRTGGPSQSGTLLQGANALGDRDWRGVVLTLDSIAQQGIGASEALQELATFLATKAKREIMESSRKTGGTANGPTRGLLSTRPVHYHHRADGAAAP